MALNTNVPLRVVGGTTAAIGATTGNVRQVVADTDKQTLVLMDGTNPGGHPMAKEIRKIIAGTPNVKINNGAEADLSGDVTVTVLPGAIPGKIELVENPAGVDPGQYLKFNYTNAQGETAFYLVNLTTLVDIYTAGDYITVTDNVVAVNRNALVPAIVKPNMGLTYATGQIYVILDENSPLKFVNGKVSLSLDDIVDTGPDSLLKIENGKITLKSVVSADADNILQPGSDKLAYMPGDLGTL